MSREGLSPRTVQTYISGLGFWHKMNDYPDPTAHFVVRKLLFGYTKLHARVDARQPITVAMLRQIIPLFSSVCSSPFETSLFRAATLLAYFTFMRVSEFAASSKVNFASVLQITDIDFTNTGELAVRIRISKTDQMGKGAGLIVAPCNNAALCPVAAVRLFLHHFRPASLHGPLFMHANGTPLTRFQFCCGLRRALLAAGFTTGSFTSHSLRIGVTSVGAMKGMGEIQLKACGRWRSGAYKGYVRIPTNLLAL